MKNLLLAVSILICSISYTQNWKDLGTYGMFGLTNERDVEVLDNGDVYVFFSDSGDLLKLYKWDGTWTNIPHSFLEVSSDLELTSLGNTLYLGFKSTTNNYEVHSYNGSAFTPLGDLSTLDYLLGATDLEVEPASGDLLLSTKVIDNGLGAVSNVQVHRFDGAAWNLYGPPMFLQYTEPDLYDGEIMSNGAFSYFLSDEFDMNQADVDPGTGGGVIAQNKAAGFPDARLYLIDNLAPSSWDEYDMGNFIINDPYHIEMVGNENQPPILGYNSYGNDMQLEFSRAIGGGTFEAEPIYMGLAPISTFDLEVGNNDSAYFAVSELPQGPYTSHVFVENNGNWEEIGAPGPMIGNIDFVDLTLSNATNKPYLLYQDDAGQTGMRVYNTPPTSSSISSTLPSCMDVSDQLIIQQLITYDNDFDSLWLWGESQNQTILTDANIDVNRINAYDPNAGENEFSVSITPESGQNGTFDIDFYTTDGIDTTLAYTVTVDVFAPTGAAISGLQSEFCLNYGTEILNPYGIPAGGTFEGSGIFNNTLDLGLLNAGNFGISYIYQDGNGCLDTASSTFEVLEIPTISLSITDASCGQLDGEADATITGGAPPYSIYWSNGSLTEDVTGLAPNMYYINVTDNNDCYVMDAVTVSSTNFSTSGTVTNVECPGGATGAIDLTVSGTGPFSYQWSNGATTEDLTGLQAGQYEVFVTDNTGCQSMSSFTVTQPNTINSTFTKLNATCGLMDGNLTANVSGGTTPYDYQWFDNTPSPIGTNSNLIGAIGMGQYSVQVTDASGCVKSFNTSLSETNAPTIITNSITEATCAADGAIDINILSNSGVQSILWSNAETTEDISGLTDGFYAVTVTNNQGCSAMADFNVNPVLPVTDEICMVTVDSLTNTNLIVWEKPVSTEISHFNVYRESSVAGVFQLVDQVDYNDESSYNDTIAYPHLRSWRYKLTTVNNCGVESFNGQIHKTIHLVINAGLPGTYNLSWDAYEGFSYPTYFVYRHTTANGWEEIGQLPFGSGTMSDTPPSEEGLDYIISINPPSTCTATTAKATDYNSSRSNRSTSSTLGNPDDDSSLDEFGNLNVQVYPNPSEGMFQIKVEGIANYQMTVYDLSGKVVFAKNANLETSTIDLRDMAAGAYMLKILSENCSSNERLIVR
ncbi:MAG: T9SS type A sorting domain-containing protein [Crocinitomicaceae bacterium]